jgi:phosphate starvation-inducible PhoH-like protein
LRKQQFLNNIACDKDNYKENILSKRKTGALARSKEDTRYSHKRSNQSNTFYMNESKTIDFTQVQPTKHKEKKTAELLPRSLNQEKYILSLLDDNIDIVVVSGPAGTGKTYLAMVAAIKALREHKCERIILTRPAVGVDDEKHGFLPGDINQKMEPWTRPLLDVLREYYSVREITHMLEEQIVEIAPLAFCRGRNFKNSWIILDEAQNCTVSQIKMILTRIGNDSKMVISGDVEQTDRKMCDNGLFDLQNRLVKEIISGIQSCSFDLKDVQRHRLISPILKMYS